MITAVPYKAPEDMNLLHTIHAVAVEVMQFGSNHETVLRGSYTFLSQQDSPEYGYFRWILFVMKEGLGYESIGALSSLFAKRITSFPPGYMDLLPEDLNQLQQLLTHNTGSRDAIKAIRKWIVERAHSACAVSMALHDFIFSLVHTNAIKNPTETFERILYTLYTINDVFYNQKHAKLIGPYTSVLTVQDYENEVMINISQIMCPYLPAIFNYGNKIVQNEQQREKMVRLATLWHEKGFISAQDSENLKSMLKTQSEPPGFPERLKLLSPMLGGDLLEEHKRSLGLLPLPSCLPSQQQASASGSTSNGGLAGVHFFQQIQQQQQYYQAVYQPQAGFISPPPPPLPPGADPPATGYTAASVYDHLQLPPQLPPQLHQLQQQQQTFYSYAPGPNASSFAPPPPPPPLPPRPPSNDRKRSWDDMGSNTSTQNKRPQQCVDLMIVPVGRMVTIIKAAMSSGSFKPYTAIDVSTVNAQVAQVEDGDEEERVKERIEECYRHLQGQVK